MTMKQSFSILCAVIVLLLLGVLAYRESQKCPPEALQYVKALYIELADGKEGEEWDKTGRDGADLVSWASSLKPKQVSDDLTAIVVYRITDTVPERRARCELFLKRFDR